MTFINSEENPIQTELHLEAEDKEKEFYTRIIIVSISIILIVLMLFLSSFIYNETTIKKSTKPSNEVIEEEIVVIENKSRTIVSP